MNNVAKKFGFEALTTGTVGKYSGLRDDEGRELVWSSEACGDQNDSNYLATREEAESRVEGLAEVLDIPVDHVRVVEVVS